MNQVPGSGGGCSGWMAGHADSLLPRRQRSGGTGTGRLLCGRAAAGGVHPLGLACTCEIVAQKPRLQATALWMTDLAPQPGSGRRYPPASLAGLPFGAIWAAAHGVSPVNKTAVAPPMSELIRRPTQAGKPAGRSPADGSAHRAQGPRQPRCNPHSGPRPAGPSGVGAMRAAQRRARLAGGAPLPAVQAAAATDADSPKSQRPGPL